MTQTNQQQLTSTQQPPAQIAPIDSKPILQSESPTAIILAIAILLSLLITGITELVRVLEVRRTCR
jgi:hypothetical protein